MVKEWTDSQKLETEKYKRYTEEKKAVLVRLKAEEAKYVYLSLHGTDYEKQAAKKFLVGIRKQIKEQKVAIQEQQEENEKARANGSICKFW